MTTNRLRLTQEKYQKWKCKHMSDTPYICWKRGAFVIAEDILNGKVTSFQVVQAAIQTCLRNSKLNAVVIERFALALKEAKAADLMIQSGKVVGPLHGVPFTVKESLGFEGLPHTVGSMKRIEKYASNDATVVARLKKAGAIVIGLSNCSEMALWPECSNPVYGKTSNPWNLNYTSGGSSGGDAAAVGAGIVPFGVGTDGGGSIRIPAAFCGVYGHKPSGGLVPLTGHPPLHDTGLENQDAQKVAAFFCAGPIAKTAKDLMPLLKIMAGPDGLDKNVKHLPAFSSCDINITEISVFMCSSPKVTFARAVAANVSEPIDVLGQMFASMGANVQSWNHHAIKDALMIWIEAVQHLSIAELISDGQGIRPIQELVKYMLHKSQYSLPAILATLTYQYSLPTLKKCVSLDPKTRLGLQKDIENQLGDNGILIMPVFPSAAPKHGKMLFHPADFAYAGLFNALELPATSVPLGFDENGLPKSAQIIAAKNMDHLCIAAACLIEEKYKSSLTKSAD
ncbi:hypothetical protein CBQ28_08780 [Pseudoalteromonas sp. GCY]|nr:hypothetical protein CBQ28_08780 [Pseudoalteromonas sp. GCY]